MANVRGMSGWGVWKVSFVVWAGLALAALLPATNLLDATFPVFTMI